MEIEKVMRILKDEAKRLPEPIVSGMRNRDPFKVLISTLISLRAKDAVTEEVSKLLFKEADNPGRILKIGRKKLEKILFKSGFYKNKAKSIMHVCKVLIEKYNGKVPSDIDKLLEIKGIGRKTATLVMIIGFGDENFICVDTHCHRFPNRLGWIKTNNPEETEKELYKILPEKHWRSFNDLVVAYGQNICVPVSPKCSKCRIKPYCKKIGVERWR
jgi:endonuclease III